MFFECRPDTKAARCTKLKWRIKEENGHLNITEKSKTFYY